MRRNRMIIGISGKAGCGKSTAAKYLVEKYGFVEVSFAAILKNMLSVAGLPEPSNRDDKEKNVEGFDFTWREAAQTLGTEWGRSLDENIWVKLTMASLEDGKNYVFSDVRFDNEALSIIRKNGVVLEMSGRSVDLGQNSSHASEKGVDTFWITYVTGNSESVDVLHSQIDSIVSEL